jgi:hypothetical protein
MTLKIYNTLSRRKEDFTTIEPGKVRMYVCGPTVYSKAHVGHAMSALVFDIIRRYLLYRGYDVNHVMNFTTWMIRSSCAPTSRVWIHSNWLRAISMSLQEPGRSQHPAGHL